MDRSIIRKESFQTPKVNPFYHSYKLTFLRKIQILIMSLTLAPIRLFFFSISFLLTYLIAIPLGAGLESDSDKPRSKFRSYLFEILRILGRLCFFFCGFHYVEVCGKHVEPEEAQVIVLAPHTSFFDGIAIFIDKGLPTTVSRAENMADPIMRTLLRITQPVLVSRDDPQSRQKSVKQIIKRTKHKNPSWPQLAIFPEGCCTNGKALITFKSGAFIPAVPVQPVLIEFLNSWDTYRWTMDGPGGLELLWYTLCQLHNSCRVTFLPPYVPNEAEKADPKLFARSVRFLMADQLNVPSTDHTFEDCRLMRHAVKLGLPMNVGLIEFAKVNEKLDLNVDKVKELLSKFSEFTETNSNGQLSIEAFAKFLNLPITSMLQEVFDRYDRSFSGFIDFREYLIGLSLLAIPSVNEDTIQFAFKVFDVNKDGKISKEEFTNLIQTVHHKNTDCESLFNQITTNNHISYEDLYSFAQFRPEYAYLFLCYKDAMLKTNNLATIT